jgi:acyl carrier protein
MTEVEAREIVVQAMRYANITGLSVEQRNAFEAGTSDIEFEHLEMDSLATMELCIAIEAHSGLSITPEQLRAAKNGNALVYLVARVNQ